MSNPTETLSALRHMIELMQPYAAERPTITAGEVMRAELKKIAKKPHRCARWRKVEFIVLLEGKVSPVIRGMAKGKLAIHRSVGPSGRPRRKGWSVTHMPTGFRSVGCDT